MLHNMLKWAATVTSRWCKEAWLKTKFDSRPSSSRTGSFHHVEWNVLCSVFFSFFVFRQDCVDFVFKNLCMLNTTKNKSHPACKVFMLVRETTVRFHLVWWSMIIKNSNDLFPNVELTESLDNLSFLKRMNRCWQDHCRQTVSGNVCQNCSNRRA